MQIREWSILIGNINVFVLILFSCMLDQIIR